MCWRKKAKYLKLRNSKKFWDNDVKKWQENVHYINIWQTDFKIYGNISKLKRTFTNKPECNITTTSVSFMGSFVWVRRLTSQGIFHPRRIPLQYLCTLRLHASLFSLGLINQTNTNDRPKEVILSTSSFFLAWYIKLDLMSSAR